MESRGGCRVTGTRGWGAQQATRCNRTTVISQQHARAIDQYATDRETNVQRSSLTGLRWWRISAVLMQWIGW